jgi:hypothetical protein
MHIIPKCLVVAAAMALTAGVAYAQDKKPEFMGTDQCKMCHDKKPEGAQFSVWKTEKHSKAFESLKSEAALKIAQERGLAKPPHEAPECLKCHVTSYDVEKMAAHPKIKPEMGVQCETCHGPASLHIADAKDVVAKKKTIEEVDWKANLNKIEEKLCLGCHNEESPTWNPEQFTKADGTKAGFDFEQAKKIIEHPNPKKAK